MWWYHIELYRLIESKEAYKYCFDHDSKQYKRIVEEITGLNKKFYKLYTSKQKKWK